MTRFLDSSVFLHAYLTPKRRLSADEELMKRRAKDIIKRIDSGVEEVLTTVIHVAEILNVVESRAGLEASYRVLARLLSLENIDIVEVSMEDYMKAIVIASRHKVSVNDAIAYLKMLRYGITEIYTFDRHFASLPGITIVQE